MRPKDSDGHRPPLQLSDIQIAHVERVVLDVLAARLDFVAHEAREHFLGLDGVGDSTLQQAALGRVHGRDEELLRVHFTETLEAGDLHAAFADFLHRLENFRDGEDRALLLAVALALEQLEERLVGGAILVDGKALASRACSAARPRPCSRAARRGCSGGG